VSETPAAGGNGAAVIAASLQAAGVRSVFAYPGDPVIEFMERCRQQGTDVVLAGREGSAAFMAEAQAMASGGLGVCVSTLGPGSTALVNGVAAANLDRVPMVAISGQIETARQAFFTHQVVEHTLVFNPVTKWAGRMEAGAIGPTIRKAIRTATAERPGAVHISCASDVFNAPAPDAVVTAPATGAASSAYVCRAPGCELDPHAVLAAARRPVILAGIGATRAGASGALRRLAETAGLPVVVAPMAKGVFPEDSPWFAGVLDMACNQRVWDFLAGSDLIVAAGFDPVELIKPWQLPTQVLHVDATPNTDQVYPSDVEVIGHVGASLEWLADGWAGQPRWTEAEVRAHRAKLTDEYYAGRVSGRLNPTDVIDVVRAAFPADTIVTTDVGSHKLLVGQGWQAQVPRSVLMTNGLSAMGFGLPAAISAKFTLPDRPVVALIGDGGFTMTATELRLASARGIGVAVVVFVDGSLNRIELKQSALGYPSTATRLADMDVAALAVALGCDGARAETSAELESAVAKATDLSRPLVIEARIDPAQYQSQF
jgi:acetolactate synthase-1/2/3 large subunit